MRFCKYSQGDWPGSLCLMGQQEVASQGLLNSAGIPEVTGQGCEVM